MLAEDGDRPDPLADLVTVGDLREVALDQVLGDVGQGGLRIDATPCERDRVAVHVGREDPHVERVDLVAQGVGDDHREAVGLLARGAACRPDPELVVVLARVRDQLRDDRRTELIEEILIAEELGDLDQEARGEAPVFLRIALDEPDVVAELRHRGCDHPPLQPAQDRGPLVAREVDPAAIPKLVEEGPEQALVVRPARLADAGRELVQQRTDRFELGDDVDRRRRQGERHAGIRRRLRILDHDGASERLHLAGARRAVVTGPREDDGDEPLTEDLRSRAEQQVDRRPRPAVGHLGQADLMVGDLRMAAGWQHEDRVRLEASVIVDRLDRERTVTTQDLGQMAGPARVEVLCDQDRHRHVGGQRPDHSRQRVDPACRRADDHELRDRVVRDRQRRAPRLSCRSNSRGSGRGAIGSGRLLW